MNACFVYRPQFMNEEQIKFELPDRTIFLAGLFPMYDEEVQCTNPRASSSGTPGFDPTRAAPASRRKADPSWATDSRKSPPAPATARTTGLGDGSRTDKDSVRITSIGEVDELNSHIGLLLCEDMPADLREELVTIQHDLFDLGGELCIPGYQMIKERTSNASTRCWPYNATLPPLTEFILPAGSRAAAQAHVCRTVCRRAERAIVTLGKAGTIHEHPRQYVNRLSDLLFVLSRVLNRYAGGSDVLWQHERKRG
jgi:cob(I)alamin adenosyltransferase